jgi:glycosyltransferase involved in cell wall biosynthesis
VPTTSGRPHLSVVVPAYNEQTRLRTNLPLVLDYLAEHHVDAEVLVVDDGSVDETSGIAAAALKGQRGRVIAVGENRGKGHAVRAGVLEASGRWVLITDADLSTPIAEHAKLAALVRDRDLDGAIGSRALADSRIEVHQALPRELMGKTFNRLVRWLTGLPFRDTQCGFKLFDRERTRPLFERMVIDRFAFDVELLFLCARFGLHVAEVPVVWRNDPRTTVSPFSDAPRMLLDVIRVRWRFRRGLYDPTRPPGGAGATGSG